MNVWAAWTRPDLLRPWWGPEKTTIPECEIDLRVGGRIYIVMEAGEDGGLRYEVGVRGPARQARGVPREVTTTAVTAAAAHEASG